MRYMNRPMTDKGGGGGGGGGGVVPYAQTVTTVKILTSPLSYYHTDIQCTVQYGQCREEYRHSSCDLPHRHTVQYGQCIEEYRHSSCDLPHRHTVQYGQCREEYRQCCTHSSCMWDMT